MGVGGFFGALLIIGGALIALLCGLCTFVMIGASASAPRSGMIGIALLLGGVPTVFGCLMVWAGVVLIRSSRKSTQAPVKPETFD